jgi:hypothetical protein
MFGKFCACAEELYRRGVRIHIPAVLKCNPHFFGSFHKISLLPHFLGRQFETPCRRRISPGKPLGKVVCHFNKAFIVGACFQICRGFLGKFRKNRVNLPDFFPCKKIVPFPNFGAIRKKLIKVADGVRLLNTRNRASVDSREIA